MSRVSTTNPFDLLGDENEDRTNVPAAPKKEQKPAAAPAKPAAKPAAATGAATAKPAAAKPEAAKAESKPAAATPATNQVVKQAPPRDANQNLQEREKESRAPRDKRDGPRQPRPAGDGKRVFDRKSGTGRPQNEVKKGGSGKGNWGGEADAKEGVEALKDKEDKAEDEKDEQTEEKVTVEGGEKKAEPAKEAESTKEVVEKEIETTTYEEYLAKQKKSAPKFEALKPRTVEDQDFTGLVALERGENGLPPLQAKEKKEKKPKEGTAAAKPAEGDKKEKGEKKQRNLAAELLTFASHQDQKRSERGPYRGDRNFDGDRRGSGDKRQGGGRGAGFRSPRDNNYNRQAGPAAGSSAATSQPPAEADFPSLASPHGSDPVKA